MIITCHYYQYHYQSCSLQNNYSWKWKAVPRPAVLLPESPVALLVILSASSRGVCYCFLAGRVSVPRRWSVVLPGQIRLRFHSCTSPTSLHRQGYNSHQCALDISIVFRKYLHTPFYDFSALGVLCIAYEYYKPHSSHDVITDVNILVRSNNLNCLDWK